MHAVRQIKLIKIIQYLGEFGEELITKANEEKKRYAKAYGEQALDFDQFKELTNEVNKKIMLYERQLKDLSKKIE